MRKFIHLEFSRPARVLNVTRSSVAGIQSTSSRRTWLSADRTSKVLNVTRSSVAGIQSTSSRRTWLSADRRWREYL